MPRTISATEAKHKLGEVMGWVRDTHDEVIIESRGEPKVVIMSYQEYEKLKEVKEQQRRVEIVARLEQLREQVRARNTDLNEEQTLELADRVVRETIDEMVAEGKICFQNVAE